MTFALSCVLLVGCGTAGGAPERDEPKEDSGAPTYTSRSGGTTVGPVVAQAELSPVHGSGTSGTAVFREVVGLGVQSQLEVSGLPTKDPGAVYYAQVHEGSCSDRKPGEKHGEDGTSSAGPTPALVSFGRLAAKVPGLRAHGGHEHGIPSEPTSGIARPVRFSASADGTASASSLLEGVEASQLTSGGPEYVHLHAEGPEDAPEELACGDLVGASRRGSG